MNISGALVFRCSLSSVLILAYAGFLHTALPQGLAPPTAGVEGMTLIPAGKFLRGSSEEEVSDVKKAFGKRDLYSKYPFSDETPKRAIYVDSFYIDTYEVSNREYQLYINATGAKPPVNWSGKNYEPGHADYPVLYVSQEEAMAYARWMGKRLPTEEEWEKAARGNKGLVFPWGDTFDPYKAATADSDLTFISNGLCKVGMANKIGVAPGDVSPFGVHDMGGNVREWTSTTKQEDHSKAIVKGAAWVDLHINARAAHREFVDKKAHSHIIGFRCAKDIKKALTRSAI